MQTYGVEYLEIIKGPINPETVLVIPDSDWAITSSIFDAEQSNCILSVVNVHDRSHFTVFPDAVDYAHDDTKYDASIPSPKRGWLQSHGMGIKRGPSGVHTLYVVNHAIANHPGRHAIEVFEVRIADGRPRLTHVGTVLVPEDKWPTDVAALPGDEEGFLANSLFDPRWEDGMPRMAAGERLGYIMVWTPSSGWTELPGGHLPCPNGLEVSSDGRYVFAACWSIREIVRIERGTGSPDITSAQANGVLVDNFVWTKDGRLLCAGQLTDPVTLLDQFSNLARSSLPIAVIEVDPETLQVTTLAAGYAPEGWGMASSAAEIGNEIWVGAARSEGLLRLARRDSGTA